jgi:hypothetical protein
MLKKAGILMIAAVLGAGAAVGVAACGEDREGDVEFQTEGTGTAAGTGTETVGTETAGTETAGAETAETETAPETETESETETAP